MTAIAASRKSGSRKALIIGVHHPPFSEGGHGRSPLMLQQIDDACEAAGIGPDALLAGHSDTYQRYTRTVTIGGKQTHQRYVMAGCGSHNDSSVGAATGQLIGDHTCDKLVDTRRLLMDFHLAHGPGGVLLPGGPKVFDSLKVDLTTGKVS